jgi:hypothetical protein
MAMIDLRLWADLGKPWNSPTLGMGNSGIPYKGQTRVTYTVHANLYGVFSDPWNVKRGIKNPDEVDFTKDHKIVYQGNKNSPTANITFDFGKTGEVHDVNDKMELDLTPRSCLKEAAKSSDYSGPR